MTDIAFVTVGPANGSAAATQADMSRPVGTSSGDLIIVEFGFEGVGSGSGPWIVPRPDPDPTDPAHEVAGPSTGWYRILYQQPSATGNGLEIWAAIHGGGTHAIFRFDGTYEYEATSRLYRNTYQTMPDAIRAHAKRQVTGDDPAAPGVYAFVREMLVVVGAHQLQSPGWGAPTPSGWENDDDQARGGTFGNVEIAGADKAVTVEGDTGDIPWSATADTATTHGATATLAIRPGPPPEPAATNPAIRLEYAVAL